jgi:hypothetical protein
VKICGVDVPEEFEATTENVIGELSALNGVPLSTGELNWSPMGSGPFRMNVGEGVPVPWNVNDPG